jgi:hypothetical protein
VKAELLDHRKFLRLKRLLGEPTPHVLGYLVLMWRRGYQTGSPVLGDALDVEAAAEYMGEPRKFATAAHEAGFLDKRQDGEFEIHDLYDHAPEYAQKRMVRRGNGPPGALPSVANSAPRGGDNGDSSSARRTKVRGKRKEVKEKDPPNPPAGGSASPPEADEAESKTSKPRPRCELFDALVALTGSDASVAGSHIGRLRKLLLAADPPYTPAEVLRMADPAWQAANMPWLGGRSPTLGEVEKYIGRIRKPSSAPQGQNQQKPMFQSAADRRQEQLEREFASAFPPPPSGEP